RVGKKFHVFLPDSPPSPCGSACNPHSVKHHTKQRLPIHGPGPCLPARFVRNHPPLCFLQLRIVTGVLQSGSLKGTHTMSRKNSDPTRLQPFPKGKKDIINAVIETPMGSRNKF